MTPGRSEYESADYRAVRDRLLSAEIELKNLRERVAVLRRSLPTDMKVPDYAFEEGPVSLDQDEPVKQVRLSDLARERPAILYQYMYGAAQTSPCPMCSMWMDGFNAVARHLYQWAEVAIVAQADIRSLRAVGRERGWHDIRLLSSAPSSMKSDFGFQNEKGEQMPGISVFIRNDAGDLCHFYSASAMMDDANRGRGMDALSPVWNLMDLLPQGRGDWMPKLNY